MSLIVKFKAGSVVPKAVGHNQIAAGVNGHLIEFSDTLDALFIS